MPKAELIRSATSPSGASVKLERTCNRYDGARPYFIVSNSKRPSRTRYPVFEDRAVATFEAFAQDITDPAEIGEILDRLEAAKGVSVTSLEDQALALPAKSGQGYHTGTPLKCPVTPREHGGEEGGFPLHPSQPEDSRSPDDQGHHGSMGGRPRKHPSPLVANRERQRAHRERRRHVSVLA